ncbi:MAG: DEAD/DEAH box helicase [Gemmatimonadota bacterium]|nr:DEAD/DEAH box helicase [Gemmatimonadota bacterium]
MALNPVAYIEKIAKSFLRYQLTAYPFSDPHLLAQMRGLLSLDHTRASPLLRGPYVSLSRPFRAGAPVEQLVGEGLIHPHLAERIPSKITHFYSHQECAIRAIAAGRTTLISTGTGSGKTECFLYPVVSRCLTLKDETGAPGISAVIVYPMNALAEDQLMRIRGLLAGTGVPFGIYVGKTPEREADVSGARLSPGSSHADYVARVRKARQDGTGETVYPAEEVCSRQAMRTPGRQPRILLTNVKQLELLLTRQQDIELFAGARLDYLVFDEAHTFTGAMGAETACLVRRLRSFCNVDPGHSRCVATSATIVDAKQPDAARNFAARFFGVSATDVVTVGEDYEAETWADPRAIPPTPQGDPSKILDECVRAVEDEDASGAAVNRAYRQLSGRALDVPDGTDWPKALHAALSHNELVFRLNEELVEPRPLEELPDALEKPVGRPVTEAEVLAWLTLGAAARDDERPLLRPVIHGFVRGIGGAVVSFPEDEASAQLRLTARDSRSGESDGLYAHFPVTTCTVCGQHYYVAFLKDFSFTGKHPGGGEAGRHGRYWESLDETNGGNRLVLVDRLIGETGSDDDSAMSSRTVPLHFCRRCAAAHPERMDRCRSCGHGGDTVELQVVRQRPKNPGILTSCLSCGSNGRRVFGRYREPARPVRAVTVADVHVLTQDMVHHAVRPRLLVFCDNRQDAAFQAGWMKDHARRFRLRALMAEGIRASPGSSVGDLTGYLDDRMEADEALSRVLLPEVWQVSRREGSGGRHMRERRKYLRIQVLREVTLSTRQALGLEPWGRMRVRYDGLSPSLPWIQEHAFQLGIPADRLRDGVAAVLDHFRRRGALLDPEFKIFTRYWAEGSPEVQQGFIPGFIKPLGLKLRRGPTEDAKWVMQWLSSAGDTTMRQIAGKWGVSKDSAGPFLEGLFAFLVERNLLRPVRLLGARGGALPNLDGVYQVNGDALRLHPNRGVARCRNCRRTITRGVPHNLCPAWRCDGELKWIRENLDDYNLQLLDEAYAMLRPEEHTAMVPHERREQLENWFKGDSNRVNSLVCTPTLELGIDIGRLDSVLMRNVPPLPANYWQRAGRAGRRHRMAVNMTYCRPVSHDRAYFAEPPKLLGGRIDPPAFNLRNEVMVAKHVHATVIASLHRYGGDPARSETERQQIREVLGTCIPRRVKPYLFDGEVVRVEPFDFRPLRELVRHNAPDLADKVRSVFSQGWPETDADVVTPEALRRHVDRFVDELEAVVARLRRRLRWAMAQIKRLNAVREKHGTLSREDEALFKRCNGLVGRLKGREPRRSHAEGHDSSITFSVLAAEGFLPGYGLESGYVVAWAEIPFWLDGAMDFALPRAPATALREYVPGNLIYANGHRFAARRFHRDFSDEHVEMPRYEVSAEYQAVKETTAGVSSTLGGQVLPAMAVCDVDLVHYSHISDDEELRFQLGVAVYGLELGQHSGGWAYRWGDRSLLLRRGVRMRLVNVGVSEVIKGRNDFGYLVCAICGQSVSPLSSEAQRESFRKSHEERCGRKPGRVGFYADIAADVLSLPECANPTQAYSVLEALRIGATRILDMHMEDLQILVIGEIGNDVVQGLLWDPMPGGSGLLDRLRERFSEVVEVAREVVEGCEGACDSSCIDCLQTFRNSYYHNRLDRRVALDALKEWRQGLVFQHDIPPKQSASSPSGDAVPVNQAETKLRHLLLRAGFGEGVRGERIRLSGALGSTTPDVIYRDPDDDFYKGVCIYLDGMSRHIHGNPETARKDRAIRAWLRGNDYEVIEIPANELDDEDAMAKHFRRLAIYLGQGGKGRELAKDRSWFTNAGSTDGRREQAPGRPKLRLVTPTAENRNKTCVPLVPLKAAAGEFGDPHESLNEPDWKWVEVDTGRTLRDGMFVAKVVGESMDPRIPDGSYCLFTRSVTGSRRGRTLLVKLRDEIDTETGERFTIKRYRSKKTEDENGWRHVEITLEPVNPDFEPIVIGADDEGEIEVVAELIEVLGRPATAFLGEK